ncbi:hypothetical protein B6V00_03440 [ANME-1 cluster archaeon ex4572_4]|nr:MAG: hypothetical protein B6V00_03440 [ANME-1 cluster archaeon ex4572_4]
MKITAENFLQHELIGLRAEVEESSNRDLRGLRGAVVDETRNMLVLEDEREKKVAKAGNVVSGDLLVSRPEDRIKRRG